jgi:DNA-binding GntR family transcriptional regulator
MQLDEAFHRQLCEAAGVPDLWVTVRSRSGHIDRLRRLHLPSPGKALAIERQHGEILDAIAAGDAALAQDRMREHLSGTLARIEEIRLRYPSYLRD